MIEHGAYTLLLDACYDRERFPTLDEAIDWLWARSDEEVAAITFVLNKFFDLEADGRYVQSRIQEELDAYQAQASTNQRIAREREAKRREARKKTPDKENNEHEACTTSERSVNEALPNHKLLTINHELININEVFSFDDFWNTYDLKIDRKKCEAKFKKLSSQEKTAIQETLATYVSLTPAGGFLVRKHPSTYLNNESWNDDLSALQASKSKPPVFGSYQNNGSNNKSTQSSSSSFDEMLDAQMSESDEKQGIYDVN